jgi:hypothetical protein
MRKKPKTKTAKKAKMKKVMTEFQAGKLRSGSKTGPKVTNPKQAVAIGLNQSGQSTKQKSSARKKKLSGVTF